MVHVTSTVLVAALIAAPALAAPITSEETHYSRDLEFLEVRSGASGTAGRAVKKVAEGVVDAYGQNKMKETVKKYTNPPVHVPAGLVDAAKKSTGGFSQSTVDAVLGKGKKKRDLELLEARSGASGTAGRVVKKVAENAADAYGQNKMKETVKKYTNPPVQVPAGLAEAAKKSTGGFSQASVNAALGKGKKKRDLEFLEIRSGASGTAGRAVKKVAENVVDAYGQNKMKETVKKYTNPPVQVPAGLVDAAKKSTGGFSQASVNAALGKGKKKRDLEFLEARSGASGTAGRAAKKVAENVVDAYGQNKMKETIKKYTNPPAQVPAGLSEAAKKSSGGFSQGAVNAALGKGKKKRDLEFLEARSGASGTAGRAAKKVAENVVDAYGQNKMKETIKKYTNPPVQVPAGLVDAAKKSSKGFSQSSVDAVLGKGKKKRDFEDLDMYERDYEDFEDVFERYFDDLEEREFEEFEEREFYGLDELD